MKTRSYGNVLWCLICLNASSICLEDFIFQMYPFPWQKSSGKFAWELLCQRRLKYSYVSGEILYSKDDFIKRLGLSGYSALFIGARRCWYIFQFQQALHNNKWILMNLLQQSFCEIYLLFQYIIYIGWSKFANCSNLLRKFPLCK